MEGYSSSNSNISLDSLEKTVKKKTIKKKTSDDNVDTILVPFYEKDVLIKVPKGKKSREEHENNKVSSNDKFKKECKPIKNYLINKEEQKPKRTTYLEIFRKQFAPTMTNTKKNVSDIRSISPEFGDTERESFGEEPTIPVADFLNTESYNEIYYEKLMNQEISNFLEHSLEEQLQLSGDIRSKSPDEDINNLKSISDVSQPRRHLRRATIQPIQNIKLGGLGPDMENIKPRLERARSLQRYSEKVRMENRVKIYKKSIQDDIDKRADKELSLKRKDFKNKELKGNEKSYLINKNIQEKQSHNIRTCNFKSKSANVQRKRERDENKEHLNLKSSNCYSHTNNKESTMAMGSKVEMKNKERVKSSDKCRTSCNTDVEISELPDNVHVPPVQISFLVNMGGVRPSSALRKLEAKHRMYQDKVKEFTLNNNNDNENN